MPRHLPLKIAPGDEHNLLTAVAFSEMTKDGARWSFDCKCGETKVIRASDVIAGRQKSCGCLSVTHGAARGGKVTPEYMSWRAMLQRCEDPNATGYENYGGRGIKVCERWHDFAAFFADMGNRPSPDHSIDRLENDLGYEITNCRWATTLEQNQKKRSLVMLTVDGETTFLADWARRSGIPVATLWVRVQRLKWSHKKAVTTPVRAMAVRAA